MAKKTFILPAALLLLVAAAVGGLFAYDGSRPTRIAKGITVGGVDVGGMGRAQARGVLQRDVVDALRKPVRVSHGKKTWTLGAREAQIKTNVDVLVDQALTRSDEGGVVNRSWRRLTGGSVDAAMEPQVTFSDRAVIRLLDRVRRGVGRKPQDASLSLTAGGVSLTPGQTGLQVRAGALHKAIDAALTAPDRDRAFAAETRKLQPKVTTKQLAAQNGTVLIASRAANTLKLYKDLKLVKTYGVAAGQPAWPTPAGQFTIANKAENPTWSVPKSAWAGKLGGTVIPGGAPNNPLKARWLGITDGVGIHGTADDGSIGSNASHGCLRMHVSDVIDLYPRVPVGAKILIT